MRARRADLSCPGEGVEAPRTRGLLREGHVSDEVCLIAAWRRDPGREKMPFTALLPGPAVVQQCQDLVAQPIVLGIQTIEHFLHGNFGLAELLGAVPPDEYACVVGVREGVRCRLVLCVPRGGPEDELYVVSGTVAGLQG